MRVTGVLTPASDRFIRRSHRGRRDAERTQKASFARPLGCFSKRNQPKQTGWLVPAELPGRGDEGGAYAATQTHVLQVFGEALGRKRSPWGFRKHIQGATKAHALERALCRITKHINAPANKSWSVVVLLLPWHPQLCEPAISHSAKSEPSRPTTLNRGGKAWPNHLLCSWACCKQSKNSCILHL